MFSRSLIASVVLAILVLVDSSRALATKQFVSQRADSASSVTSPPLVCTSACSSFVSNLSSCKLSTSVTDAATAATELAKCVCPFFTADTTCDACLVANASSEAATSLFGTLVSNCKSSTSKAATTIQGLLSSSSSTSSSSSASSTSGAVLRDGGSTSAGTISQKISTLAVVVTVALAFVSVLIA